METGKVGPTPALPRSRATGIGIGGSSYANAQEKRRQEALNRQKCARRRRMQHAAPELPDQDLAHEAGSRDDAAMQEETMASSSGGTPANALVGAARARRAAKSLENGEHPKAFYSRQLMVPEWLTDVPSDLGDKWYVMPRPEGRRCLLVSSGGQTVSRLQSGAVLHRMQSPLPDGSPSSCGGLSDVCMLDCIYHEPTKTYYIQDLLVWSGHPLQDCTAEFRLFWLHSKLIECDVIQLKEQAIKPAGSQPVVEGLLLSCGDTSGADFAEGDMGAATSGAIEEAMDDQGLELQNRMLGETMMEAASCCSEQWSSAECLSEDKEGELFKLTPLPVYQCELDGFMAAHSGQVDFIRDGIYLLHKEGQYTSGSCTPLALLWKDLACSRYLLDTDLQGTALEHQMVVLEYRMDQTVATADEPPVVLGRLPKSFVDQMGTLLRPGRLLKFSIQKGGIQFLEGRPCGADLKYEGPGNQRRGRSDHFSKILFQYCARTKPIEMQCLLDAIGSGPQAADYEMEAS